MRILPGNNKGVTATFIMLFGLLALSVVLLDGISITTRKNNEARAIQQKVIGYCYKPQAKLPIECTILQTWRCDNRYILRSNCPGVGDLILDAEGEFAKWCGYTAFGEPMASCGTYWLDANNHDCLKSQNLCKK